MDLARDSVRAAALAGCPATAPTWYLLHLPCRADLEAEAEEPVVSVHSPAQVLRSFHRRRDSKVPETAVAEMAGHCLRAAEMLSRPLRRLATELVPAETDWVVAAVLVIFPEAIWVLRRPPLEAVQVRRVR